MTYDINDTEKFALSLPITQMARTTAHQFASEQSTLEKAEQVRLNTLAVHVVNDYLQQIMGIPTDLSSSDSWNPIVRLCANVADLEVTGVGRLECRPLRSHQSTCHVPPEVWLDRIGYVVVEIDESLLEATVLGFSPTVATEELSLSQLRPVEDLIDHLNPQMPALAPVAATTAAVPETRVNLSQWLVNVFQTGWQTVETLLNPAELDLAYNFRSADSAVLIDDEQPDIGIKRGKLIDLGIQLASRPVALIVEVTPESADRRNVLLQVHPTGNQIYLPPLLQLTVLDQSGLVFLEAQTRSADNYIQLQFSGLSGEQFSVKVALDEASITEDFVL